MTVYSWNMLFRNRESDKAFEFIRTTDFDIFCLQEVPEEFLSRLRTLPYHIAVATDVERLFTPIKRLHLVMLSKHPIIKQEIIPFPEYRNMLSLRTRIFVRFMRPLHWTEIQNRSCFYADVSAPEGIIRVFNLHTALVKMDWRINEFETAMERRNPILPTIVCGDMNVIESPRVSLLNWLLGGPIGDAIFYKRERTRLEQRFKTHKLCNPLHNSVTHSFANSQLDHILVSNEFSVERACVLPNRYGSDHNPVLVDMNIKSA